MSWQSWIDNMLAYQPVNVAAIFGPDGSVWAKSSTCTATDAEVQNLIAGLGKRGAGDFSAFTFQGVRFMTLRLEDGEIDGKAKDNCLTAVKSAQCIVVGAFIETAGGTVSPAANQKVNLAVAKVKEALAKSGY